MKLFDTQNTLPWSKPESSLKDNELDFEEIYYQLRNAGLEETQAGIKIAGSFPNLEPVCCSMPVSNCCFLTCIQSSQEAGQVVRYSHRFKYFPEFVVIHTKALT